MKEDSKHKEDPKSSIDAPEPREQEPVGTERSETSSHLKAFDRVLDKPSPGGSPDTPVLGVEARSSSDGLQDIPVT